MLAGLLIALLGPSGCIRAPKEDRERARNLVPQYDRFEYRLRSSKDYANPPQEVTLTAVFTSPSGREKRVYGFWDGGRTWRIRFSPDELGPWRFRTICSDPENSGLHGRSDRLLCSATVGDSRFDRHGPVRVASQGQYFEHQDGTPFFWMTDTAWNGPLKSSFRDWVFYLTERKRQRFTGIQWVPTQWRGAPEGDRHNQVAFTGRETIRIQPDFFQRLDERIAVANHQGFLSVPVLLWAGSEGPGSESNPGYLLPEDQAVILARYMVARWDAHHVAWILAADGNYRQQNTDRWKRIGRAVFEKIDHAPVTLHPKESEWYWPELRHEEWLDFIGYQSGHGDDSKALTALVNGPPTVDWEKDGERPFINLEPPYENRIANGSGEPHRPYSVRRALYWSLLNVPSAGVSYGGHGVWDWGDGLGPPQGYPNSGSPLPWEQALRMTGAEEIRELVGFFQSIAFWELRPDPDLLAHQPGEEDPAKWISSAQSPASGQSVIYTPSQQPILLNPPELPSRRQAVWFNPRTGRESLTEPAFENGHLRFDPPGPQDWVLLIESHAS